MSKCINCSSIKYNADMRKVWRRLGTLAFWLSWPGLWLYLRRTRRTRLLLITEDKVLVVRAWLSDGRWQLPGGGLHAGENPEVGVVREVREETSAVLDPALLIPLGAEPFRSCGLRFYCHYYAAQARQMVPVVAKGPEIVDSRWLDRSELRPETCGADVLRAVQLLEDLDAGR